MDEEMVREIRADLMTKLNDKYGFCGVMDSDHFIMLNSGKGNIVVKISWEDE